MTTNGKSEYQLANTEDPTRQEDDKTNGVKVVEDNDEVDGEEEEVILCV